MDISQFEKLPAASGKDVPPANRNWSILIQPFANSDRMEIKRVGADVKELKPWSTYLYFELCSFTRYPEWMYEAAKDVGETCTMAFEVIDGPIQRSVTLAFFWRGCAQKDWLTLAIIASPIVAIVAESKGHR